MTTREQTNTMTAAIQSAYGADANRVVAIGNIPVPSPRPDQVLIEVTASSVNALDWHYMTGTPYFIRLQNGLVRPRRRIPGADVAGVVVEVGAQASGLEVGDQVFGEIGQGGFAQFAVASPSALAKAPTEIPLEEAASLGVAALTALQGLRDWACMTPGDRVLINGGSGGVGTFAIQIAKALGASHVTAVVSTDNVQTAYDIGADRVVDYKSRDFTTLEDRFDILFDNAGSKSLGASREMLEPDGVLVMITGEKGRWFRPVDRMIGGAIRSKFWSQRWAGGTARASRTDSELLAELVDRGAVRPVIDRRFTLEEATKALAYQAEGHARGKSLVVA